MKNIVLIDFLLSGHHQAFLENFSNILCEENCRVFVLVPGATGFEAYMKGKFPNLAGRLIGIEYPIKQFKTKKLGKFSEAYNRLLSWRYEASLLAKVEKNYSIKIDLVFYAWLDNQFGRLLPSKLLDLVFPYKWSGLFFHPYHLRLSSGVLKKPAVWRDHDSILLSKNCMSVAIHDKEIVEDFSLRINKKVLLFPEIADSTPPDHEYEHYKGIKRKAKGRIIVGIIGCESFKGTLTMIRMARLADPNKYFFAYLGSLPQHLYNEIDWREVQDYIKSEPENAYFHFHPIPEGSSFNAAFDSFDILFSVYDNFISSSNRLKKASIFKKLVLASDNYCVGNDVKTFNLGITVKPMDPTGALAGLEKLSQKIQQKDFPENGWQSYREINSYVRLREKFREVLKEINK
jgi:hypothetical protein